MSQITRKNENCDVLLIYSQTRSVGINIIFKISDEKKHELMEYIEPTLRHSYVTCKRFE